MYDASTRLPRESEKMVEKTTVQMETPAKRTYRKIRPKPLSINGYKWFCWGNALIYYPLLGFPYSFIYLELKIFQETIQLSIALFEARQCRIHIMEGGKAT